MSTSNNSSDKFGGLDSDSIDGSDLINTSSLYLFLMYIVGIYTFVHKASLLSAAGAMGAWSSVATVVVHAFWIIGLVGVGFIAVFAVAVFLATIGALVFRSGILFAGALLGLFWFGGGYLAGTFFFGQYSLLVSFVLGAAIVSWIFVILIAGLRLTVGIIGIGLL